MELEIGHYLRSLELANYSKSTLKHRRIELGILQRFLEKRDIFAAQAVTEKDIFDFMIKIKNTKSSLTKDNLSSSTLTTYIVCLRTFFSYLKEQNAILVNPAQKLKCPRQAVKLPRGYFTEEEVEKIFSVIDINNKFGIRDRAMLELLYSTGLRASEALSLKPEDIDFEKNLVFVRHGKGAKERMTPIGKHALFWVKYYLDNARIQIIGKKEIPFLFVGHGKNSGIYWALNQRIRIYKAKAGICKIGAAHLFRHTCATHMLKHGADIRYVQEMLGHEHISTTSVYTKVTIGHLKEAYHKVF